MLPKEFIKITFLKQYRQVAYKYHYISFMLIGIGIEFLGKCLDDKKSWQQSGFSKIHFNRAINELMPKYISYNNKYNLHDSLRNGMAHALLPKYKIGLTNRQEAKHFDNKHLDIKNGELILVAEDLYDDFRKACNTILDSDFKQNSKMNTDALSVPQDFNLLLI
ncbi:MAG: hypothetical protein HOG08_00520 [Candidatus Magasanikbacteria bacterium]|jgi:hypothetical protein|nr:hypothetical protein [Candidatus Magasanikbacteria bacterium]